MTDAVQVVSETERANVLLHPTRLAILERLDQPSSAAKLARRLNLPRQRLNYHLRQLEEQELVSLVEEKKRGSASERIYSRTADSFAISIEAIGRMGSSPDNVRDRISSAYQIAHASRVIVDLAEMRSKAEKAGKKLPTIMVEADVRFADAKSRHAFTQELTDAVADLVRRYHDEAAPDGRRFHFYLGGYPERKVEG